MIVEVLVKQFFNAVRHVIGEVIRAGLVGLVLGIAFVELAGAFIEGHWPFHPFVHLLAVVFGLVLGYAIAMTVAFFEGVKSIFGAVGQVENEIEGTIRSAVEGTAARVGDVVDAVEHHPQHRPAQVQSVAPPTYNPNPQPAPQYVESPPYGQTGQNPQNPQYGQYGQYGQSAPPQNPQYPPRQ